jgi:hypothetical protein
MESLFKENSNKVDNTRLLETDLGNMICYNENDTMRIGEFCYIMLDSEQEFLGEITNIGFTDDDQICVFLLGIDGKEYGFLIIEIERHLTIEEKSTQNIERAHECGCSCGCCCGDNEFDVLDNDDVIGSEIYEYISQVTGMLSDMTQDEATAQYNIIKKSVF